MALAAAAIGSLCASADAALTSLPEARLQLLVDQGSEPGFARYAADRLGLLSRWLVARVTSMSIASILIARAIEQEVGLLTASALAVAGSVLTYATFAEILGTIARRRPEEVGRLALRFLRPLEWAVLPVAAPLAALGRWIGRTVPESLSSADARTTHTEVEWLVDQGEKTGAIDKEPATMIRNVLDFKNLTAKEVMIPRRRVSSIAASTALSDVLEHVRKDGHSRYPVYRETLDNVVGLLYVKDLFDVLGAGKMGETKLEDLIRKPVLFLAETQSALSVLREMRSKRLHLAIVSDEFGGTAGLITIEDVLEEIVGEINDEYDDEEPEIEQEGGTRFWVSGRVSLDELSELLAHDFVQDDIETVGGLVYETFGRVPRAGESAVVDSYRMVVERVRGRRVERVYFERVSAEPAEEDE